MHKSLSEQVAELESRVKFLEEMQTKDIEHILEDVISRIAQHACRQGESGGRSWPPLHTLPFMSSWKNVGETYAKEVAMAILATALRGLSSRTV